MKWISLSKFKKFKIPKKMLTHVILYDPTSNKCIMSHSTTNKQISSSLVSLYANANANINLNQDSQLNKFPHWNSIEKYNILWIAVSQYDTQPILCVEFLNKLIETVELFLTIVNQQTIKAHFILLYELIQEMLVIPFFTEPCILKQWVPPPSILGSLMDSVTIGTTLNTKEPSFHSHIPWRDIGLIYTKNEIFFDFNEEIQCVVDDKGSLVHGRVLGTLDCTCKLSGMPELLLSFSKAQAIPMGMIAFHSSVKSDRYDTTKTLSLIPPDGHFILADYVVPIRNVSTLPIHVNAKVLLSHSIHSCKLDISLQPRTLNELPLQNVSMTLPLPRIIKGLSKVNASMGSCCFDSKNNELKWEMSSIASDVSMSGIPLLSVSFDLHDNMQHTPSYYHLRLEYKQNQSNVTGLEIKSIHIHQESYQPFKVFCDSFSSLLMI